ncbi:MAG: TRAP transporter large permease subunit, partial [Deltaproteobacteria bacterium]|nr:TRAP transporter large permease subunit [Deltaproteobacteria bacterium]
MAIWILVLFFVFGILGMPIGFLLGVVSIIGFLLMGEPLYLSMLSTKFFSAMNSYVFLALPLFLLAGDI